MAKWAGRQSNTSGSLGCHSSWLLVSPCDSTLSLFCDEVLKLFVIFECVDIKSIGTYIMDAPGLVSRGSRTFGPAQGRAAREGAAWRLFALQRVLRFSAWEILVPYSLAIGTGYLRLPFSITWWLVLLAAFAVQTRFLLAVATVLSLSVLLTWYGLRLRHAEAITALWAGDTLR